MNFSPGASPAGTADRYCSELAELLVTKRIDPEVTERVDIVGIEHDVKRAQRHTGQASSASRTGQPTGGRKTVDTDVADGYGCGASLPRRAALWRIGGSGSSTPTRRHEESGETQTHPPLRPRRDRWSADTRADSERSDTVSERTHATKLGTNMRAPARLHPADRAGESCSGTSPVASGRTPSEPPARRERGVAQLNLSVPRRTADERRRTLGRRRRKEPLTRLDTWSGAARRRWKSNPCTGLCSLDTTGESSLVRGHFPGGEARMRGE